MGRHESKGAREARLRRELVEARVEPRTLSASACGAELALQLLGARSELVHARVHGDWSGVDVELVDDVARAIVELGEALAIITPILDPSRLGRVKASLSELERRVRRRRHLDLAIREVRALEEGSDGGIRASELLFTLKRRQRRASEKLAAHKPPIVMLEEAKRIVVLATQPVDASRTLGALAARHVARRVAKLERLVASPDGGRPKLRERRAARVITRLAVSLEILGELTPRARDELEPVIEPLRAAFDALTRARIAERVVAQSEKSRDDRLHRLELALRDARVEAKRAARRALATHGPALVERLRASWPVTADQAEVVVPAADVEPPGASASSGAPSIL
ncbi:hypothetical protein L6R52_26730 [Myxococcota bacterium]|nr:hypothetical protein [Myxococcota bacterium]